MSASESKQFIFNYTRLYEEYILDPFIQFQDNRFQIYIHKKDNFRICVCKNESYPVYMISPLILSVITLDYSVFDKLLTIYPDNINEQIPLEWPYSDDHGKTALHFAVQQTNVHFVSQLLKFGADPNLQSSKGLTPIMMLYQEHQISQKNDNMKILQKQLQMIVENNKRLLSNLQILIENQKKLQKSSNC